MFEDIQLTPHFKLSEFIITTSRFRNVPTANDIDNIRRVAMHLEFIRTALNKPIRIESGYRSKEVNKDKGGSSTSLHLVGLAADIDISNVDYKEMPRFMRAVVMADPYEIKFNSSKIMHLSWSIKSIIND